MSVNPLNKIKLKRAYSPIFKYIYILNIYNEIYENRTKQPVCQKNEIIIKREKRGLIHTFFAKYY
jgi:hypothetical protein